MSQVFAAPFLICLRHENGALLLLGLTPWFALTPAFTLLLHGCAILGRLPQPNELPPGMLFKAHLAVAYYIYYGWPVFMALISFGFWKLHCLGVRIGAGLLLFNTCGMAVLYLIHCNPLRATEWVGYLTMVYHRTGF